MVSNVQTNNINELVRELERRNRAALSRFLTLAATGQVNAADAAALRDRSKGAPTVIAVTGSGGAGKSSLLGALAAHLAERGESVGVLACDPESPVTRGALLGDRIRIVGIADSERIFVRSLSTPVGRQGIAENIEVMLDAMKVFGFDRIFVETVGAGQGEVAVRWVADIVVLVLQPQTGDELQWEKAGILEVADIVVVNKADLPGSDQTVADVTQQLRTTAGQVIPVVKTSIARKEGLQKLLQALDSVSVSRKR
jgi:LAO/AO transport system ATPase